MHPNYFILLEIRMFGCSKSFLELLEFEAEFLADPHLL